MTAPATTKTIATLVEILGLGCVVVLYLSFTSGSWLISPDSVDYVEGARGLASGQGFVLANGQAVGIVPPGTSLIYAVAALVPAPDYRNFNLITKAFAAGFVVLSYLLIRRKAGRTVAAIAAISIALSPVLIRESARLLSDVPFAFLVALTFWLYPEDVLDDLSPRAALRLGVLLSCAYLVRTVGLALWLGYTVAILFAGGRGRWRRVATVGAPFSLVAVLLAARSSSSGGVTYLHLIFSRVPWVADSGTPALQDWFNRISANAIEVVRNGIQVWPTGGLTIAVAVLIASLTVLGVGIHLLRSRPSLLVCVSAFYASALLISESQDRYLLPLLPLLAIFIADGAAFLAWRTGASSMMLRIAAALAVALVVLPSWLAGVAAARDLRGYLDRQANAPVVYHGHEAFAALAQVPRLSDTDVVATMHAGILRYFLPRTVRVEALPILNDAERVFQTLNEDGVTYLFCDKQEALIWERTEPVIRAHPASFRLVAETPTAAIYQVVK